MKKSKALPSDFDRDMLMALRYAYYAHTRSIVTDQEYDRMEAEYELLNGKLPVGSSSPDSYTPAQRSLAMYFLFSSREVKNPML